MLDVLFVILAQAAAGPPAEPAHQTPPVQEEHTAPAAPTATSEDDRNRRRCRIEPTIGSRMGRQVCLSQAEEQALEREGRALLERSMRMFDNQSTTSGGVNGP